MAFLNYFNPKYLTSIPAMQAGARATKRALTSHHAPKSKIKKDIKEANRRMMPYSHYTEGQRKLLDYLTKAAKPGSSQSRAMGGDLQSNPLYQQATGLLSQYLNPNQEMINRMQAPAMRQFKEQILPDIANQYAGYGALSSSGFANAATGAATNLQERLNAQQMQMQQDALSRSLGYAEAPFKQNLAMSDLVLRAQPNNFAMITGNRQSPLAALAPAIGTGAGAALGGYLGGPVGAGIGSNMGGSVGTALANRQQPGTIQSM